MTALPVNEPKPYDEAVVLWRVDADTHHWFPAGTWERPEGLSEYVALPRATFDALTRRLEAAEAVVEAARKWRIATLANDSAHANDDDSTIQARVNSTCDLERAEDALHAALIEAAPRFHRWRFIQTDPTRYRCDECGVESDTWSRERNCAALPRPSPAGPGSEAT